MYPNLYKKNAIQYDKFSRMFHNRITKKSNKCSANSNEKLNLARGLESFRFNNDSIIERDDPSLIFDITNSNKFNFNNGKENFSPVEKRGSYVMDNKENKSTFGFFKNPNKHRNPLISEENKKFYYDKKFVCKSNNNEEDDIISNFNLKHNKFYNYLLKTNSFTDIQKKKSKGENDSVSNLNNNNNDNIIYEKPKTNINSIESQDKKQFENICRSKENLRLSLETERSNSKSIKNSFYYSLKGKLLKQSQANQAPGHFTTFNNEEINLKSNRALFGNSYHSFHALNNKKLNEKQDIIREESNFNDSQVTMKIQESSLIRTKQPQGESSQNSNFQLEKVNLERESVNSNSPKRIKDIVLNNQLEKEYMEVEKRNNPITSLIYNHNKGMTEEDFYRNFNIFNMNNLNLSHIKLKKNFFSKSPDNYNSGNYKQEKINLFPKTQVKSNVSKELVLDGVYNIVELNTNLKKKKNKFIITNSHFIV